MATGVLVSYFACVVEAVLLDVLLDVHRATDCPALGAAVRGFVGVEALVGPVTALVGEQHWAQLAHLGKKQDWGGLFNHHSGAQVVGLNTIKPRGSKGRH